jgi:hypothetical protein
MMHHGGNTIIADQHSFFLQEMYGPTSFPTIYLLQEPKKLHRQHPVKEQLLAVSWCSCHNFNVCNTQCITNIYCICVSYIPYNIALWDSKILATKSQLIFSFAARPFSSAWFTKSCKSTAEVTCNSKVQHILHYKNLLKHTFCWHVWETQSCVLCMQKCVTIMPKDAYYAVGKTHP